MKFLGPIMRFSSFMVFLHLIILISLSISPLCHAVSHAADRSKKTMPVLSRFSKPASTKKVSAKFWSVVSLPGVKPACSIGSISSIIGPIRKRIILYIQLFCIGNSVKRCVCSYEDCQLVSSASALQLSLHVFMIPPI